VEVRLTFTEETYYAARASCLIAVSDNLDGVLGFFESTDDTEDRFLGRRLFRLDSVDVLRTEAVSVCFSSIIDLFDVVEVLRASILLVGVAYGR
jgi:hypothetical protein